VKTVLVIGSDFAPSSLPPATRVRFFVNHLPEFGWRPLVLTVDPEFYDWPIDPDNLKLIPETTEVVRTEAWSSSWTRKLGIGDIGVRSFWHQWQALKRICRRQQVDLIFIPVPPYVPMVLGRMAHKKFGIPYVIDYIDPWVTEYYWKLPRDQRPPKWPLAYAMARVLEPYALKRVSHITGVSKGTTDSVVSRYRQLTNDNASEIPYGAEADDFDYLRRHPRANPIFNRADGLLHLSYVGACIPSMHAAVRALFAGINLGLKRAPEVFERLRLHFVGTSYAAGGATSENVIALAGAAGIERYVTEQTTRVSYLDSLQVMVDSHALFLVGSDEPHYTASKVFPYVLSQRPLLAIFHEDSSVVKILKNAAAGDAVVFNDQCGPEAKITDISERLGQLLLLPSGFTRPTNSEVNERYTTRAMTERLAASFERIVSKDRLPNFSEAVQNA
jgi:hypothetical protein